MDCKRMIIVCNSKKIIKILEVSAKTTGRCFGPGLFIFGWEVENETDNRWQTV